jgi:membrane protease YdiL (CAAX protease family)
MVAKTVHKEMRPAPVLVALLFFASSSILFFFFLYLILPLLRKAGVSWFFSYNIALVLPMAILLLASFIGYRFEGLQLSWPSIRHRFRLQSMKTSVWLWAIALSIFMYGGRFSMVIAFTFGVCACVIEYRNSKRDLFISVGGMTFFLIISWGIWQTEPFLGKIILHDRPDSFLEFQQHFGPKDFMGIPLSGQWWLIIYYTVVLLVFNIAGEELWWRGYILPRQELANGKIAWLIHGLLWASFHLFLQSTLYDLVRMFPTCCALSYVAQRSRNTWPGIIGHTFGNSPLLLQIIRGVLL